MNIYLREMKAAFRSTIVWSLSLAAATSFVFAMFPAFSGNATAIGDALKNYPLMIQLAFGLYLDQIGSVNGFYSFIVTFLTLVGSVQAMTLGLTSLSKETTRRTADFLLTKPVSRLSVSVAKLLAALSCVTLTSGVYVLTAFLCASAYAPFAVRPFFLMSLSFFLVQVMFLALGFLASASVSRIRSALPAALSAVSAFFIIGAVSAMLERQVLYFLSPFKYFDTYHILMTASYRPAFVVAWALVVALSVFAGMVVYIRRDVRA